MIALETLLDGPCCHMSELPGHPFDLGPGWQTALAGGDPNWDDVVGRYVASVDWPASSFYAALSTEYPNAVVLLSTRGSVDQWLDSFEATVLKVARDAERAGWSDGRDLLDLIERFTGTSDPALWSSRAVLAAAYERHNQTVRDTIAPDRLVDWHPGDGWDAICEALAVRVPNEPFPWVNRREDWG